jgi:hypothetical protein
MPRPVITAANILEKHRREDGGADLLVQVTLQAGDIRWLAVRKADATLTATRTIEGHGRRLVTVPARRTLKAGLAGLLTDQPEILRENRSDAKGDHWELYRDEFDRRERRSRLERKWRVHELALVDAEDRSRRQTVRLVRLSCTGTSGDSDEATQFVLELGPGFDGRLRCLALGPAQSAYVTVNVEHLRGALLRPGAGLSELLVDVTNGFTSEQDAKLAFAARRRFLPDDHCIEDRRMPNAVRATGTGRRQPDSERHVDENDADTGESQSEAPAPTCHVDEKSTRRGRPPKYNTDEERATAERQRKAAWARRKRQAGLLKETAESLRERQRRRLARLKASSEVRR